MPFAARSAAGTNFIVPLHHGAERKLQLYFRIADLQRAAAAADAVEPAARRHDQRESMLFGLYFGCMIVMLTYNLLLFLGIRDWSYHDLRAVDRMR